MKNKKGFAFIETIITVVILSASLLLVYSTYNAILNDEKTRIYYDDPAFIYYTNYVRNFLEENVDMDKIKKNSFKDSYAVVLGNPDEFLFTTDSGQATLERIENNFNINQIVLIKKDMFNKCFNASEEDKKYCSLEHLSNNNISKYINSLSDITYDYTLVVEYSIKLNDSKEYVKCTQGLETKCQTYYASVGMSNTVNLNDYVISKYTGVQGENGLYYHNGSIKSDEDITVSYYNYLSSGYENTIYPKGTSLDANDGSYRYAGANPNNYVCFGSEDKICPADNLYRIIGVFGEKTHEQSGKQLVKLIKADFVGSNLLGTNGAYATSKEPSKWGGLSYKGSLESIDTFYWNSLDYYNMWSGSNLNKTNLNTNYLTNIGTTWSNKIATTTRKVGENYYINIISSLPATAYESEIVSQLTKYNEKIGLMYVSDYYYAASESAWKLTGNKYNSVTNNNWLYLGFFEWTNSSLENSVAIFDISSNGDVTATDIPSDGAIRPVFYLKSSVLYVSGSGTFADPIRIN